MEEILEPWGFSVLDVENLRLHYARTLEHWLQRFEGAAEDVAADVRRALRPRLAAVPGGLQAAFATGWLQLFQVTFARAGQATRPGRGPGCTGPD